jgi:hypothetical protein
MTAIRVATTRAVKAFDSRDAHGHMLGYALACDDQCEAREVST